MRLLTLLLLMTARCALSFGQESNINQHISIKALYIHGDGAEFYSFRIDIYRVGLVVKIIYSVLDSTSAKNIFEIVVADSTPFLYDNTDSIALCRNLYKMDSIIFLQKNNIKYDRLLDSCFSGNDQLFESQLAPDIIYTDGVPFKIILENKGKITKTVGAISPNNRNYPFLSRLIYESFALYRPNPNHFLTKQNTNNRYLHYY